MVCSLGESLTHRFNQMKLFNVIATAAVIGTSLIAATPAEARCRETSKGIEWCARQISSERWSFVAQDRYSDDGFSATVDCRDGYVSWRTIDGFNKSGLRKMMHECCLDQIWKLLINDLTSGSLMPTNTGLKAIQNPKGKSRGRHVSPSISRQNTQTNKKSHDHRTYRHLYCCLCKRNQSHSFGWINAKSQYLKCWWVLCIGTACSAGIYRRQNRWRADVNRRNCNWSCNFAGSQHPGEGNKGCVPRLANEQEEWTAIWRIVACVSASAWQDFMPDFYIFHSSHIGPWLKNDHQYWQSKPKRNGEPRKDGNLRNFRPSTDELLKARNQWGQMFIDH